MSDQMEAVLPLPSFRPLPHSPDALMLETGDQLAETPAEKLLLEWYRQWAGREDMPKMNSMLHVRTVMYFVDKTYADNIRTDVRN